jgi:hypothetical protein
MTTTTAATSGTSAYDIISKQAQSSTNSSTTTTQSGDDALASLSGDYNNFLTLLTAQLKNQDPLSPMDTTQFTQQLVQFSAVEQQINGNKKLDQLIGLQSTANAYGAVGFVGGQILDRGHAGDVAEAAQRSRFDAVLRFATPHRPQRGAKANEIAAHLHAGGPRHPHVPAFVQRHRHQNGQREQRHTDDPHHLVLTTSRDTAPLALSLAQRCASSTSSTVAGSAAHWSAACSTSAIVRTMAGNRIFPSRKASAASSLAAL